MAEPGTWVALVLTIPSWIYLHESAHALTLKLEHPNEAVVFQPYPHRHEGHLFWGDVHQYRDHVSNRDRALSAVSPRFVDAVGIAGLIMAIRRRASHGVIAWLSGALGDLAFATIGSDQSDLAHLASATSLSRGSWRAIYFGGLAVSIGAIIWAIRNPIPRCTGGP